MAGAVPRLDFEPSHLTVALICNQTENGQESQSMPIPSGDKSKHEQCGQCDFAVLVTIYGRLVPLRLWC